MLQSKGCKKERGPGILRDKTMDDNLLYIPNDDKQKYPFCGLELIVESLEIIIQFYLMNIFNQSMREIGYKYNFLSNDISLPGEGVIL